MSTKRRRVWVREYGQELGSIAWHARREAIRRREGIREDATGVAAFVERLPGDVVLSREEQYDVAQAVAVKLKWLLNLEEEASDVVTVVQYELKSRGRR